jgi:hypothetical protein
MSNKEKHNYIFVRFVTSTANKPYVRSWVLLKPQRIPCHNATRKMWIIMLSFCLHLNLLGFSYICVSHACYMSLDQVHLGVVTLKILGERLKRMEPDGICIKSTALCNTYIFQ